MSAMVVLTGLQSAKTARLMYLRVLAGAHQCGPDGRRRHPSPMRDAQVEPAMRTVAGRAGVRWGLGTFEHSSYAWQALAEMKAQTRRGRESQSCDR